MVEWELSTKFLGDTCHMGGRAGGALCWVRFLWSLTFGDVGVLAFSPISLFPISLRLGFGDAEIDRSQEVARRERGGSNESHVRNRNLTSCLPDGGLPYFADWAWEIAVDTTPETSFHYEVACSEDEHNWKTTTITCHGRLVSGNAGEIKELVKPLIAEGGHIVIDFADLKYLDSLGLGTLVGLKVSAINKGFCKLELVNLSPRVRELLSLTNLTELFSR